MIVPFSLIHASDNYRSLCSRCVVSFGRFDFSFDIPNPFARLVRLALNYINARSEIILSSIGRKNKMFAKSRCVSKARLDGKTAIVTGSNTGIGKITAKEFYRIGKTR